MGLYDRLEIELPLPDPDAQDIEEWQTKSFDHSYLRNYKITTDGRLLLQVGHYEDCLNRDTKDTNTILGMLKFVPESWEDINYHGWINFYSTTSDHKWIEYEAKFTDGNCVQFKRVKGV